MKLPEESKLRDVLANRPLLGVLIFDVKFRILFFIVLVLMILFGVSIPKIWTVTPEHFTPRIKISLLDMIQSRSLERTARKATLEENHHVAMFSWHAAIANNPSRPVLYRGSLTNSLAYNPKTARHIQATIHQSLWLLRLSQTNQADLNLCARVWEKMGFDSLVAHLPLWTDKPLPDHLKAEEGMARFRLGEINEFLKIRDQLRKVEFQSDKWDLYCAAFSAGWRSGPEAHQGFKHLQMAQGDPVISNLAHRLSLKVYYKNLDNEAFRRSLDELAKTGNDLLNDHLLYWSLLTQSGQSDLARNLVIASKQEPLTPEEGIGLSRLLTLLEMEDEAVDTIEDTTQMFPLSTESWLERGKLFISIQDWNNLISTAYELQQHSLNSPALRDLATAFEAKAKFEQDRRQSSRELLTTLASRTEFPGIICLYIANLMMEMESSAEAEKWMLQFQPHLGENAEYWRNLTAIAYNSRNAELLTTAAEKAYEIQPQNPVSMNNYAAALLINRQKPFTALGLTLQLFQTNPHSLESTINHAIALIMNLRAHEGLDLLNLVDADLLDDSTSSIYHFAAAQAFFHVGELEKALESSEKIDPGHLFKVQSNYLDELLAPVRSQDISETKSKFI